MGVLQTNAGTFNGTGFTVTLPGATTSGSRVVVLVAGNTTVNTPATFTLRTSQVTNAGQYWFDVAGGSGNSWAFTNAGGQGQWCAIEVAGATFGTATGNQATQAGTTQASPSHTPAAGNQQVLLGIVSLQLTGAPTAESVSSVTGGFTLVAGSDKQVVSVADWPEGAAAAISDYTSNGATALSSTVTFSASANTRGTLIGSYTTSAATATPTVTRRPIARLQAVNRAAVI